MREGNEMDNEKQLTPAVIYELFAYIGFKRHFHLGGMKATRELIELCHIDRDKYVLDVGCASGKTACYIAKTYGCRVVGVDISEGMVNRANERAKKERVKDRVSFKVANAQDLPFEDNLFDVVIGKFISGLLDNKQRGINEYLRVTKPGGYVGLNEATWIKTPPPIELVRYLSSVYGVKGETLDPGGWEGLLASAGSRDMVVRAYQAKALSSKRDDLMDVLRVFPKMLYLYIRNSTFRSLIKEVLSIPKNLLEYFGYGIYVGRK